MYEKQEDKFHKNCNLIQARYYPSTKNPFPHQNEALSKLHPWFEGNSYPKGGILVLPTGSGKTFVAVRFLCKGPLSQGYKVLWLAHTHHLLEQAFREFVPKEEDDKRDGFQIAGIAEPKSSLSVRVVSGTPGHFPPHQIKKEDDIIIGTLQTITNAYNDPKQLALKAFLNSARGKLFVVFDEAHHSPAPSYRKLLTNLRQDYPEICLLGLTATPTYTDEKKRGWLLKLFPQNIIYQVSPQKLMAERILAKPVFEKSQTHFDAEFDEREYQKWKYANYKDIPAHIIDQLAHNEPRNSYIVQKYVKDKKRYGKTIIFTDRWHQCVAIREMLIKRGIKAGAIYSHIDADPGSSEARNKRNRDENDKLLEDFRNNKLDVLINIRMLTEGTDIPDIQTAFLTRQTTSKILLTQMIGRALRGPKCRGTETAYIVSFIDNWEYLINWADYDQLEEGLADETIPEYGKRPPLQLISIELIRKLARQLDSGININPGTFLSLMPIGWYRTDFTTLVEDSDTENIRQLVMVFENEKDCYEKFIQHLLKTNIQEFENEQISYELYKTRLEEWKNEFFSSADIAEKSDLSLNLLYIARHIAQNDGEPPVFFPFSERDNHDLDKIAQKFAIEDNLGRVAEDQALQSEYSRKDRYWSTIYYNYPFFKSQYDACVNRLLGHENQKIDYNKVIQSGDEIQPREPTEDVKEQVKARDGYRCLCCGEMGKRRLEIDHVAPSYYGGDNSLDNLQTLCKICHRTKGTNELNFRNNKTLLTAPPSSFPELDLPIDARDPVEWEKFLRRSINSFYQCAAVDFVRIGKRGQYFYDWYVYLFAGNNPLWLDAYIDDLVNRINYARRDAGGIEINTINVDAPD